MVISGHDLGPPPRLYLPVARPSSGDPARVHRPGGCKMSVATIHDLDSVTRPVRPVRPVPDAPAEAPASVTVTVRIDLPGGRLPDSAADLVASLRALATAE